MSRSGMSGTTFIGVSSVCARARSSKGHESTKMQKTDQSGDHERFKELSALAQAGALSLTEQLDLRSHLQGCGPCREIYEEYRILGEDGMCFLSSDFTPREEARNWESSGLRR